MLRYTYGAIGGGSSDGMSHFDLPTEVLALLRERDWIVIVDEMQQAAAGAMAELVWLYEQAYHSFGIVVSGSGVLKAVKQYPQLATRIMGKVQFQPLTGEALLHAVTALDPRLAATPHTRLLAHNQALCLGRLRPWVLTIRWLDVLGIEHGPVPTNAFLQIEHLMVESAQEIA